MRESKACQTPPLNDRSIKLHQMSLRGGRNCCSLPLENIIQYSDHTHRPQYLLQRYYLFSKIMKSYPITPSVVKLQNHLKSQVQGVDDASQVQLLADLLKYHSC